MRWVATAGERLLESADRFEPRGPLLACGRALLGLATMTVILGTPDGALFPYTAAVPSGQLCSGARAVSLWCLAGPSNADLTAGRLLSIAVLALVIAGYRPRWTCIPHYYVTFSFASASPIVNGGDRFAQIAAMLLIPICLGDERRWQWQPARRPLSPTWRGCGYGAHLTIRVQLSIIYAGAALSKILDPAWRRGDAMPIIAYDSEFGLARPALAAMEPLLHTPVFALTLAWLVVATELTVAGQILGPRRLRLRALFEVAALHLAILLGLGLVSFSMAMIAFVLLACGPRQAVASCSPSTVAAPLRG
jgi:antimicrobial peptide system SdpB family protein